VGILVFSTSLDDSELESISKHSASTYIEHLSFRFFSNFDLDSTGESIQDRLLTGLCLVEKFRNPRLTTATLVRVEGIPKPDFLQITYGDKFLGYYDDSPESELTKRRDEVDSLRSDFDALSALSKLSFYRCLDETAVEAAKHIQNETLKEQVSDIFYQLNNWEFFCQDGWNKLSEQSESMNFLVN
jgi:hypothetical protein